MKIFSAISLLFFSYLALAEVSIKFNDNIANKKYNFHLPKEPSQNIKKFHQGLLLSSTITDPSHAIDFHKVEQTITGQKISRLSPIIDGIIAEGADGIYVEDAQEDHFEYTHFVLPSAKFVISAAEALEKALAEQEHSLLRNPFIEKIGGTYEKVWFMHFGNLRPSYKTRLPTLSIADLKDIYVDAENGDILRIEDSALFLDVPAKAFLYSPKGGSLKKEDLADVMLPDLIEVKDNGFLEGEYMQVRTCCKYYTCPTEGPCTNDKKRCALSSHEGARQSRETVELPTNSLGLDPLMSLPPTIFVDTVRCTYLPFAKASKKEQSHGTLGFFDEPIDEAGAASEMDRFSEIQAYFSMMSFFKYIRSLLENPQWCLRSTAMSCDSDGKPVFENGKPVNPYRVFVNQLIPDMKMGHQQSDPENFIVQILAGKGSKENPIVLNTLSRMGNAAFVPALSQLKTNTPRADEILSDLIKEWDHNVFFQGEKDFAYDGDVVFHEFMHAITTSLVNKLNSLGLDKWGIHSEPGSLNEGWSDYFSAAFTNDANIGEYAAIRGGEGEASLRNIDNKARCPDNIIGEIHNDSQVWSGALWAIRKRVKEAQGQDGAIEFDKAVLNALSKATTSEDFKTQSEKLLSSIRNRPSLGDKVANIAEEIFDERGIKNCFRAYPLSSVDKDNKIRKQVKPMMFIPSKNQIGLKNYAPSSSQLAIAIPAGAKKLTLSWKQFLGGTGALLGTESTPSSTANIIPLSIMKSFDEPIVWKFKKESTAYRGEEIIEDTIKASYDNDQWTASLNLDAKPCEQRLVFVSMLSHDFKYIVSNLKVEFEMDDSLNNSKCNYTMVSGGEEDEEDYDEESGCSTTTPSFGILMAMLMLWLLKRRTR